MKVLLIDNYDSFTYNLVQALGVLGAELKVFRNDRISVKEIERLSIERIIISPGPGNPTQAGISCELVLKLAGKVPILGVCLGHQCIGYAFGGKVVQAKRIMHGKTSLVYHSGGEIHSGLDNPFSAMRYHSLALEEKSIPDFLRVSAWSQDKEVMAIENSELGLYGVQYHPESFLTPQGILVLKNFLELKR